MAEPPVVATVRRPRWLPVALLAAVWLAAAWPVVLWLVHLGDPEAAVRLAQTAGRWLGTALLGLGVALLAALVAVPPARAALRLGLSRARRLVTMDRSALHRALSELQHFESAARHLEAGRLAHQLDETELAARHLRRALELDGGLPAAHHLFARTLWRAGEIEAALAHFEQAERLDPGHAFGDALLFAGRCRFRLGRVEQAAEALREHERRHGGSRRSHLWLGDALAAIGDHAGARAAWQIAAAPGRLTAEENWSRALARVRLWRRRRA